MTSLWAAAVLAAAAVVAPGTSYACAAPAVYLPTLTVTVDAREAYRRGQVAELVVRVRREAPGVPSSGAPADVTMYLRTPAGARLRHITGTAKDDGRVALRWRIPEGTRPTAVHAEIVALHALTPGEECYNALVYEHGETAVRPLTRVVR